MEIKGMENLLSVAQAASLCSVGHSTVGYWVRKNKLRAQRLGRQYSIPVEELLLYLKSNGQKIPEELAGIDFADPDSRTLQNCWQHFKDATDGHACDDCFVFKNRVEPCFTCKGTASFHCSTDCPECTHYMETYLPGMQFIHQLSSPAAIAKDFYLWGGNKLWAELCGVGEKDLPGMGIEQVFHPDSLEMIITGIKKKILGYPSFTESYETFFKNNEKDKIAVHISIHGLDDPPEALLILAEPKKARHIDRQER